MNISKRSWLQVSRSALVSIAFLATVVALPASAAHEAELSAFEQYIQQQMEQKQIPGLSVAVWIDGEVWSRAYGYADLENQTPVRVNSSYRMASVTKTMTATAVMKLVEEGKMDLDAEIQTYVPYFPKKEYPITIRQLLGHLSGISHYQDREKELHIREHLNTQEAIAIFAEFDLIGEPGLDYSYSSYGFNLVGAAIEGASGMSYGDYLRTQIWEPMGMRATVMDDPTAIIPNRVRGYRRLNGKIVNSEYVDMSSRFAAGGTRSTVEDMIRFVQGLDANTVLTPESTEIMWTTQSTTDGWFTRYGLGWNTYSFNGRRCIQHGGSQTATRTRLTYFPESRIAVALATNLEGTDLAAIEGHLWWLLTQEGYNARLFVGDDRERALYAAMRSTFRYGMLAWETAGRPVANASGEMSEAFATFNETLDDGAFATDPKTAAKTIRQGVHPGQGEISVRVGEYMAAVLCAENPGNAKRYRQYGGLVFFADYVKWYRDQGGSSNNLSFSEELETAALKMGAEWERVWTPEARKFALGDEPNANSIDQKLRALYSESTLLPDYTGQIRGLAEQAFLSGDPQTGAQLAMLGAEFYPRSEQMIGLFGVVNIAMGQIDQGRELLLQAGSWNPNGFTEVSNLLGICGFFSESGNTPAAKALLEVALEIHPDSEQAQGALAQLTAGN